MLTRFPVCWHLYSAMPLRLALSGHMFRSLFSSKPASCFDTLPSFQGLDDLRLSLSEEISKAQLKVRIMLFGKSGSPEPLAGSGVLQIFTSQDF